MSSANYYIQQQSMNYMYMTKHKILWISCCYHSLNCIYSKSCKFHAESTFMKSLCEVHFSNKYWMGKPQSICDM